MRAAFMTAVDAVEVLDDAAAPELDPAGAVLRVEAANGVPVVLAGGSRLADADLLTRMEHAMAAGAIGCSVGRNIFMHEHPEAITRALSRVIRERWSAQKALDALTEETG